MIIEFLKEDESRVRWSYDDGNSWRYADIDELITAYEKEQEHETLEKIALELLNKYQKAKTNNIIKRGGATTTKELWVLEQECTEIFREIMESGEREDGEEE